MVVSEHPAFTLVAGYFPTPPPSCVAAAKRKFSRDLAAFVRARTPPASPSSSSVT